MNELTAFFTQYGLILTGFAILGIVVLGILKYCNLFSKLDEKVRHILYLVISVCVSVLFASIYLACIGELKLNIVVTFSAAVYALNQAWYCIFKTTSLNALVSSVLDKVFHKVDHFNDK